MSTILFRADASATTGGGHAMRSLALAEAHLARGGKAVFVMAEGGDVMASRLAAAGVALEAIDAARGSNADAEATLAIARARAATWIVVDGYVFAGEYQRRIRDAHDALLSIDDWGLARPHFAKMIVDVNVAAIAADYAEVAPDTTLMLGCDYALLRDEFTRRGRRARPTPARASRILVTFGAADPAGATAKVVDALGSFEGKDWQAKVIVGPANPSRASIAEAAARRSDQIELLASAPMAELMAWSDLALTAGGSTLWELAYCGVPMMVIAAADNQVRNADRMGERGLATNLGWHGDVDAAKVARSLEELCNDQPRRVEMSQKLEVLVDGAGCRRIVDRLAEPTKR